MYHCTNQYNPACFAAAAAFAAAAPDDSSKVGSEGWVETSSIFPAPQNIPINFLLESFLQFDAQFPRLLTAFDLKVWLG